MGECFMFGRGTFTTEYTPLTYIESSGTQYIDTGFAPNNNTRVCVKVQLTDDSASAWVFGGRTSTTSATMGVFWYTNTGAWTADYNGNSQRYGFESIDSLDLLEIDYNKNVLTINGYTNTFAAATFQSTGTLVLFGLNTAGTVGALSSAKLYSCQIYDNGTLVRSFVPALYKDGSVGLWDKVEKKFYANAGSGKFDADIPKVMISFTIEGVSYTAESGMTWAEWCDSDYNTDGWYVYDNMIADSSFQVFVADSSGAILSSTATIIADYAYTEQL